MNLKLQYNRETGNKNTTLEIVTTDYRKIDGLIVAEEDVEELLDYSNDIVVAHPDYVKWLEEKVETLQNQNK